MNYMAAKKKKGLDKKTHNSRRKIRSSLHQTRNVTVTSNWFPGSTPFPPIKSHELVRAGRGRRSQISDPNLHNRREQLVQIFEACWGEIGWKIRKCKTPDDLIPIFSALPAGMSEDRIMAFNMLSATQTVSADALRMADKQSRALVRPMMAAQEEESAAEKRLNLVRAAMGQGQGTEEQLTLVKEELEKSEKETQEKQEKYWNLMSQDNRLRERLRFDGGRFARQEMLHFLRSKRYELTPLSLANAVAGLPYMGWRQSMRRCSKDSSLIVNGSKYQVFKAIRYLLSKVQRKSDESLVEFLREAIPKLPYRYRLAKTELASGWYFFERALRLARQEQPNSKAFVFEVTKHFFKQQRVLSHLDIFLAEQRKLAV